MRRCIKKQPGHALRVDEATNRLHDPEVVALKLHDEVLSDAPIEYKLRFRDGGLDDKLLHAFGR